MARTMAEQKAAEGTDDAEDAPDVGHAANAAAAGDETDAGSAPDADDPTNVGAPGEPPGADAAPQHSAPGRAAPEEPSAEAAAEDAPAEEAQEKDAPEAARRRRIADPVLAIAIVLVLVAGGCAAYFGWSWYRAAHDEGLAFSRARDVVLRSGEQAVQNLNTLDYRKVDQGLRTWEDSTTGDLHQQLVQGRAQFTAQVQLAKTVTTARVLDGAVTELDDRAGRAGMIVAVQITVTPPSGTPATKQSRLRAELTRTSGGWKLSALGQAPVGTTAGG